MDNRVVQISKKLSLYLTIGCVLLVAAGCVRNPATRKVHARLLSNETERKIGLETKARILDEYQVLKSTQVQSYVNRVGQKLASVCDRPTVDYDFVVLDNDLINAFAAPGGYIFVTRGLIENIDSESELAMVLGHEIAHVTALHGVQTIQKEMGQNALTVLGSVGAALVVGPEAMLMMANTASLFSALYLLGYSRENELEADRLGLQYLLRAAYDPTASVTFLKKLQAGDTEEAKGWDLYFRTHPATYDRISIIESMVGPESTSQNKLQDEEFKKIKASLPRVNAAERGVIKDHTYFNALHNLTLSVPSNWIMSFIQPQSLVTFETVDKKGAGRLQVVELSSMTFVAETLALEYGKIMGYKYISGRNVLYAAGYGFLGRFFGISPSGKPLDIRLYATIRYGLGYILQVGAPPEEQESYLLDLEQITRALRFKEGLMGSKRIVKDIQK